MYSEHGVPNKLCKAIEEMMNEREEEVMEPGMEQGMERGRLSMLIQLVRDGDLKPELAAKKANMTMEQFEKIMKDIPLQAV